jgi:hypothetical protein
VKLLVMRTALPNVLTVESRSSLKVSTMSLFWLSASLVAFAAWAADS